MLQLMDDLRSADVDFLTIGQYLQPTRKHTRSMRFVTPDEFKAYETIAYAKGFLMVSASAADALLAPCRRGFRAAEGRARRAALTRCMPQFRTTRRVAIRAAEMFDLVADMERYPEFVPLCRVAAGAQAHAERGGRSRSLVADMTVAYKLMRETFTSRVTLDRPNLQILVEYLDGPFSQLENRWTSSPSANAAARSSSSSPTNSGAACSAC